MKKNFWILTTIISIFLLYSDQSILNSIQEAFIHKLYQSDKISKKVEARQKLKDLKRFYLDGYKKKEVDIFKKNHQKIFIFYAIKNKNKKIEISPKYFLDRLNTNTETKHLIKDIFQKLLVPEDKLLSAIHPNTKILDYKIIMRNLILDLNSDFLNNYYGKLGTEIKLAQIVKTYLQFPEIESIEFKIKKKKINYIDREGIISNKKFKLKDIKESWNI